MNIRAQLFLATIERHGYSHSMYAPRFAAPWGHRSKPWPDFRFLLAWLGLAMLLVIPGQAGAGAAKRHVLYINSYQNGYTWSDDILEGLREGFAQSGYTVDIQVEYLDTKRHAEAPVQDALLNLLAGKFQGVNFDIALVSDNAAFSMALTHGRTIYGDIPVVFGGVNDFQPESLAGKDNFTGVLENPHISQTLALAMQLHPNRRHLLVIGATDATALAIEQQVKHAIDGLDEKPVTRFVRVASLAEIRTAISTLPPGGMVYVIPFYLDQDSSGPEDVTQTVASLTDAPIYSDWDFMLGRGIVGGKLLSGKLQGRMMAQMATRILGGDTPAQIPVMAVTDDPPIFDYLVLQRLGLRRDQLPSDSRLINEPIPFYELQKPVFWTIIASLAIMAVTLFFLASNVLRRWRAERTLISQLSFMRRLLDTLPQLVYWKDAEGRYQGANRAFAEFFGLVSPADIVGKGNQDFMDSHAEALRGEQLDVDVLRTGEPSHNVVWTLQRNRDTQAVLEVNKVPLQDPAGKLVGVLTTAEDVTGRVSLERQLIQSQKMEAIGTFVGGIAHDFNNILTTIINSAELALLDLPETGATAEDIRRALSAARQGGQLVKQIHTYGRPVHSGLSPTDLRHVVGEALGLVRASLPGFIRLEERLGDRPVMAMSDPTQVHQVVMNLCTNAFQAMQRQGGTLEVALEELLLEDDEALLLGLAPGRYARLTVADDGPGIPAHIVDKIFDPFFTTKGKGEGTGLGLAVVQGIATSHDGAVHVESIPGEHTAFHVYLPSLDTGEADGPESFVASAAMDADAKLTPPSAMQRAAPHGTEHVLFVEDDPAQLASVPRAMRRFGYHVTSCAGAEEAMALLRMPDQCFDILVTDFDMPDHSGVDLAEAVTGRHGALPVILVSGRDAARDMALNVHNIRRVLLKPYSARMLCEAIRGVLDQ